MYTYYLIKVEFSDGDWGYVKREYCGDLTTTQIEGDSLAFGERRDAENFFYNRVKRCTKSNGASITRVFITTIGSERPM